LLGGESTAGIEAAGRQVLGGGIEGKALGATEAGERDQGAAESAMLGRGSDEELFDPAGRVRGASEGGFWLGREQNEEGKEVPGHPDFSLLSILPQEAFAKSGPGVGMTPRGEGMVPSVIPAIDEGLEISGDVGSQQADPE